MRSDKPLKLFRIWDVILIVILLALVGLAIYFVVAPKEGANVEIYVDGELFETLPLSRDTAVDLDHLKVIISGGTVRVEEADCHDKICEKRGRISRAGESIVCLPNRVVVRISGEGEVEAIS